MIWDKAALRRALADFRPQLVQVEEDPSSQSRRRWFAHRAGSISG
jgi:hypothetical protein